MYMCPAVSMPSMPPFSIISINTTSGVTSSHFIRASSPEKATAGTEYPRLCNLSCNSQATIRSSSTISILAIFFTFLLILIPVELTFSRHFWGFIFFCVGILEKFQHKIAMCLSQIPVLKRTNLTLSGFAVQVT